MIKINNLEFYYKKGTSIINNLNLDIEDGECIAIIGKNGSGKSTLAKLIAGIEKPRNGDITIDDLNTRNKNDYIKIRKKIGIVFQNPENQIIFNNIDDELAFALKNLNLENRELRINQALEKVKMKKNEIREIDELSLGQKQKIAIADVLAVNPKYIVFDEPTTMIDSEGKENIYNVIKGLKERGYTIIYVTNNTEEILLADKIVILNKGKIVEQILKKELLYKTEILKKYGIKIPTLILIMEKLMQNDINVNLNDWTIEELLDKIIGEINHEKRN